MTTMNLGRFLSAFGTASDFMIQIDITNQVQGSILGMTGNETYKTLKSEAYLPSIRDFWGACPQEKLWGQESCKVARYQVFILRNCYKKHPDPCQKFAAGKCKDSKCSFLHAAPICTFFLKNKCDRKHCKFTHPSKPAQQKDHKSPEKGSTNSGEGCDKKRPSSACKAKKDLIPDN